LPRKTIELGRDAVALRLCFRSHSRAFLVSHDALPIHLRDVLALQELWPGVQAVFLDRFQQPGLGGPHPHSSAVDGVPRERRRLHTPADAIASLQHDDLLAGANQAARRHHPGESGAHDHNVCLVDGVRLGVVAGEQSFCWQRHGCA
jgi:hypothetical protein